MIGIESNGDLVSVAAQIAAIEAGNGDDRCRVGTDDDGLGTAAWIPGAPGRAGGMDAIAARMPANHERGHGRTFHFVARRLISRSQPSRSSRHRGKFRSRISAAIAEMFDFRWIAVYCSRSKRASGKVNLWPRVSPPAGTRRRRDRGLAVGADNSPPCSAVSLWSMTGASCGVGFISNDGIAGIPRSCFDIVKDLRNEILVRESRR